MYGASIKVSSPEEMGIVWAAAIVWEDPLKGDIFSSIDR
jgi:hypothetical protein